MLGFIITSCLGSDFAHFDQLSPPMKQYPHACLRFIFTCLLFVPACLINNLLYASEGESGKQTSESQTVMFPPADFYPYYLADPRAAQTAIKLVGMFDSDIEDTSNTRFNHGLGKRFGLVRFGDESTYKAWQIDFDVGYFASFDVPDHTDNIGWDGIYGLYFSRRLSPTQFIRFGTLHDSAHLGDEYAEETGRQRIDYTREELLAGMAWLPNPRSKIYTELGWAWNVKKDMEPLRWQFGAEYYGASKDHYLGLPWYAATDFALFEERDWEPAITLQLGLIYTTGNATERYRFVLEAYSGRSVLGEFSFEDESYLSIGVYYDH